jgi:hypothetical protein
MARDRETQGVIYPHGLSLLLLTRCHNMDPPDLCRLITRDIAPPRGRTVPGSTMIFRYITRTTHPVANLMTSHEDISACNVYVTIAAEIPTARGNSCSNTPIDCRMGPLSIRTVSLCLNIRSWRIAHVFVHAGSECLDYFVVSYCRTPPKFTI